MWNTSALKLNKITNQHQIYHVNHSQSSLAKHPDPGRLLYRQHNVYLNFLETFGRLPPKKTITIHQKALFLFWMSTILIWTLLQISRLYSILKSKTKDHKKEDDVEWNKNDVKLVSMKTKAPNKVLSTCSSPRQSCQDRAKIETVLKKFNSAPNTPSKRKDYLDSSAFNVNEIEESVSLTDITVKATLSEAPKIERRMQDEFLKMKKEKNAESSKKSEQETDQKGKTSNNSRSLSPANVKDIFEELLVAHDKDQPTFEKFVFKMLLFGFFLFYFFLCDYLHLWPKVEKQYSRDLFVFLFFWLVFVAVVFSLRKTKEKFLNRDQTEEWKGWMQVQFVWYHYFDAQETFNSIRVYVGAYVWMTGFGNYIYFSTRKDYTIFRLLKMLFRLNFLVFCIMAVTDHEFVRYYICAMHTYWFLSVYAVMVVLNKYNDNKKFMLLKFGLYAIFNAMVFLIPGASEKIFTPFKWALHDQNGTLHYWKYRAWLDHWSTLCGMLLAFNYQHIDNFFKYLDKDEPATKRQRESLRYLATIILLSIFGIWFYHTMPMEKHHYLDIHPFTSPIPITLYALLRNIHPVLRTYNLDVFTWLGKITLETYLSQIHLYMMGDAKAILVYIPRYPMLNFTFSTLLYITISYTLFHMTVFFSSYIFPRNIYVVTRNLIFGILWLGSCYSLAYILTYEGIWKSKNMLGFLIWKVPKY